MLLGHKTAIISGCSRGIGLATLEVFVEHGCRVFACLRSESPESELRFDQLRHKYDGQITPVYFDLQDSAQMKSAIRAIFAETKQIDVLVNNAGIASGSLMQMTSSKEIRRLFDVNFFAHVELTQLVSRQMAKTGGSIINMTSTAGIIGDAGTLSYGASKAALAYATKVMATELGRFKIRVNGIAPSVTRTDMYDQMDENAVNRITERTALGRVAEPNEIANVVAFLASDLSSFVSGQIIRVDGGMTT